MRGSFKNQSDLLWFREYFSSGFYEGRHLTDHFNCVVSVALVCDHVCYRLDRFQNVVQALCDRVLTANFFEEIDTRAWVSSWKVLNPSIFDARS